MAMRQMTPRRVPKLDVRRAKHGMGKKKKSKSKPKAPKSPNDTNDDPSQPGQAATTSLTPQLNYSEIPFYYLSLRLPPDVLGGTDHFAEAVDQVLKVWPGIAPVTWDEVEIYLTHERMKPRGHRALTKYMCLFIIINIENNEPCVKFISRETKEAFVMKAGAAMLYPAVDLPPDIFGTIEDPIPKVLYDKKGYGNAPAKVVQSYWLTTETKGPDDPSIQQVQYPGKVGKDYWA